MTTFQSGMPPAGVPERICEIARDAAAQTAYRTRSYMDHVDIIAAAVMKGLEGQAPAVPVAARSMLFKGPMVRGLLDDRKTQTRRLLSRARTFATQDSRPVTLRGEGLFHALRNARGFRWLDGDSWTWKTDAFEHQAPATYTRWNAHLGYAAGDLVWVREAHALLPASAYRMSIGTGTIDQREHPTDRYTAAVFREGFDRSGRPQWRPSIHMPRWASRLTLRITEVRVQRLHDITEADAEAEGVCAFAESLDKTPWGAIGRDDRLALVRRTYGSAVNAYRHLWETINGADSWALNPWVIALTFTARRGNIDEVQHG